MVDVRTSSLREVWNWLPTFRAVAESEHLPSAAAGLGVTPSAVSRTISLLEAALEAPLFHRVGRALKLNASGRALLDATRAAEQRAEEGLRHLTGVLPEGDVMIALGGDAVRSYLVPAIARFRGLYPEFIPHLITRSVDVDDGLLRGDLDVAFVETRLDHPRLECEAVGVLTMGVYCGPGHPLYEVEHPCAEEVFRHTFAVPPKDSPAHAGDGWPPSLARRVGMYADRLGTALQFCVMGEALVLLPDMVSQVEGRHTLRRLPVDGLPQVPIFGIYRKAIPGVDWGRLIAHTVREQLSATVPESANETSTGDARS